MNKNVLVIAIVLLVLIATNGCYRHETAIPVPFTNYAGEKTPSENLIVMLPGRGGNMKDFDEADFIALAKNAGISSDIVTVDLHEGYYFNRTMIDRLRIDVIEPALKKGYRKIWFAGVSLGGFGALMYTKENNANVAGILVIAPFLGDKIVKEIKDAGGIESWQPGANSSAEKYEVDLWRWLKEGHGGTPLYLVYGNDDRMAYSHTQLAKLLPDDRTISVSGGHNWKTWTALWKMFLDRNEKAIP